MDRFRQAGIQENAQLAAQQQHVQDRNAQLQQSGNEQNFKQGLANQTDQRDRDLADMTDERTRDLADDTDTRQRDLASDRNLLARARTDETASHNKVTEGQSDQRLQQTLDYHNTLDARAEKKLGQQASQFLQRESRVGNQQQAMTILNYHKNAIAQAKDDYQDSLNQLREVSRAMAANPYDKNLQAQKATLTDDLAAKHKAVQSRYDDLANDTEGDDDAPAAAPTTTPPAATAGAPVAELPRPGKPGTVLSADTPEHVAIGQAFLNAAGGDKDKARALAKQNGWSF